MFISPFEFLENLSFGIVVQVSIHFSIGFSSFYVW